MGDDAKVIQAWMASKRGELLKARIKTVGLKGGGYSGYCFLESGEQSKFHVEGVIMQPPNQQWSPPPYPPPSPQPRPPRDWLSTGNIIFAFFVGVVLVCSGGLGIILLTSSTSKNGHVANSNSIVPAPKPPDPPDNSFLLKTGREAIAKNEPMNARRYLEKIEPQSKEYAEAQALLKRVDAVIEKEKAERQRREQPADRVRLKEDYVAAMIVAHPHLNFIKGKVTPIKGGHAIWATHSFFGRYTLEIGGTAKVVQAWISANRDELRRLQIKRVGVMGDGYSGSSWLEIE
jgi:hypothetical protein